MALRIKIDVKDGAPVLTPLALATLCGSARIHPTQRDYAEKDAIDDAGQTASLVSMAVERVVGDMKLYEDIPVTFTTSRRRAKARRLAFREGG